MICLVSSQVISYIKARAEASGLSGDGGLIERPERLAIVLVGAGLSDLPFVSLPWVLDAALWVLAVASLVTVGSGCTACGHRPGAMEPCTRRPTAAEKPRDHRTMTPKPSVGGLFRLRRRNR